MTNTIADEIRYATLVHAPVEAVYDGIATSQGLDGWFTQGSSVEAHAGGRLVFRWHEFGPDRITEQADCPVLEAEHGKRFVFQWKPDTPDYATTIEIDFEPVPADNPNPIQGSQSPTEWTVIRLREYGYQDTPSGLRAMLNCSAGWGEALTLWKFYIEHGLHY